MLCNSVSCTACGSCVTICPKNCIRFTTDDYGYTYPYIDTNNCINCGMCEKACPVLTPVKKDSYVYPTVYCASSKNTDTVLNSASGGIASEITRLFTKELNGFACGVKSEEDNLPGFVLLDSESDFRSVSGSKYVHSRDNGIYKKVKECLDFDKKVFFCGLPCQVAALYSYIGGDNENLFTADIVCHGCSEESVYKSYLEYLQDKKGERIVNTEHTSKDKGWSILIQRLFKIEFESGDIIYRWSQQDAYLSLFLDSSIFRPACYNCKFARFPRVGDITLGDFFGIGTINNIKSVNKNGVNMVMLNTEKGQDLYDMLLPYIDSEERDIKEAVYYNLNLWRPSSKSRIQSDLQKSISDINWDKISDTYYNNKTDKTKRLIRKTIKTVLGDKNTARLMLYTYNLNGITQKADEALDNLKKFIANLD